MTFLRSALLLTFLCFAIPLQAQKIHTYVGRVGTDSFLLAWGTTDGDGNTIGRELGPARQRRRRGRRAPGSLRPELGGGEQPRPGYGVSLPPPSQRKSRWRGNRAHASRAGNEARVLCPGGLRDREAAPISNRRAAMERELVRRLHSDNPVRFVLTTGDNIYPNRVLGMILTQDGRRDRDWGPKFFQPYAGILKHIPFYPSPGNHDVPGMRGEDGNGPGPYLDNFFSPAPEPSPYYTYSYGGLADFFALDTTPIQEDGVNGSIAPESPQLEWLQKSLAASRAPWKIAYFHHAPFNAGPGHGPSLPALRDVVRLFGESGVRAVFSGHEHNFQFSRQNDLTGGALYVVSGAGGQLRSGNIRDHMDRANIAGTAPQQHFLLVEVEGRTMRITPLSWEPVRVMDSSGRTVSLPIVVEVPSERTDQ